MLRGLELRVLQALQDETSITGLADRLSRDKGDISKTVSRLEEKHLVHTRRDGKQKLVTASDTKAVELLQQLGRTHPHVDVPKLLSGKTLRLLYYLHEPHTVAELAEKTGEYRNTVNRNLNRLRDRGILRKQDAHYQLTNEFRILQKLADELVHHQHRQTAAEHTTDYTILWDALDEFLLQTGTEINHEHFLETGPERFQDYDLPLVTTEKRYYLYSKQLEEITPAHLLCHTLLIDDSTRYKTYCLLLIAKDAPDLNQVSELADHYGVSETVETLFEYLESRRAQQIEGLPRWRDFKSTADDYGVEL